MNTPSQAKPSQYLENSRIEKETPGKHIHSFPFSAIGLVHNFFFTLNARFLNMCVCIRTFCGFSRSLSNCKYKKI